MTFDTLDAYWQDIKNIPTLSEEEEKRLGQQIQSGNERAIDKLVTANLRFVVSIARKYADKEVSMDDLISEGNIALMMAARKWNPEKDVRFVSYASHDVRKAIEQALPVQGPMITLPKNDASAGKELRRYSADAPVHPGQTNTLGDMLKADKPMTDTAAEDNEISYSLTMALRFLNEREKDIIKSFYGIGGAEQKTMAEIGEEKGYSRERVRQIRKTAERKMRRAMKKAK
ncbi:MAG: sigma-70 family RNA polymerase sigma factor [Prevotella sp.]|nr:sigma-70 family RNA polymerase sigma factor [Candidatus Prevotella equi]